MEKTRTKQSISAVLILTLMLSVFVIPAVSADNAYAASKMKISKKKATLKVGKKLTLKVKNKKKKKKVKWSSSKKSVATVSKKGKVTAKKAGKATITAKVGKKKFKCKITVKAAAPSIGTAKNPYNPYNGITMKTVNGTMYFKLNSIKKGNDAIVFLKTGNEWSTNDELNYGTDHPGTTIMVFDYDVKAVSGYTSNALRGLDIINRFHLYDGNCDKQLPTISTKSLSNDFKNLNPINFRLSNGQSSKMYEVMYVPNNITSFSNGIFDQKYNKYWVKYTL